MDHSQIIGPDSIPPWVTPAIRAEVDLSELSIIDPAILHERDSLSAELGANVAVYPISAKGRSHGLCSVFRAAGLSQAQIQRLQASERKYSSVSFVAYCKPLQRHNDAIQ
jgi:hypothetical protein